MVRAPKQDTAVRQEQIVQAALALIAEEGLKSLNVASLAERVGLVPSGLYRHFTGKDAIIDAVLDLIEHRLSANVEAACKEANEPLICLHRLLERHIRLVCENAAIPKVVFSDEVLSNHPTRTARLYRIIRGYLRKVADVIQNGQQTGSIRHDVDADTLSVMFLGLIQPAAILWHASAGNFDLRRHAERAWSLFAESIAVHGPTAGTRKPKVSPRNERSRQ
jgi:AcrR family transcriptional regulator